MNTYNYALANPVQYIDPYGLAPWDRDGMGDTSICSYYDQLAQQNPSCDYFPAADQICRGKDDLVNFATNSGINHSWLLGNTEKSQSEIYDSIRQKLVFYDRQSRQSGKVDGEGCTCGDTVDFYHFQAFEESGIHGFFYGVVFGLRIPIQTQCLMIHGGVRG